MSLTRGEDIGCLVGEKKVKGHTGVLKTKMRVLDCFLCLGSDRLSHPARRQGGVKVAMSKSG